MDSIPAKQLLTPVRAQDGAFFATDYTLNLYRGCPHGCVYCDSRSACYRLGDFDRLRKKENALALLRAQLQSKRRAGVVGMGASSDPYHPQEAREELTRGALALLQTFGFGVMFATKGGLAARDADILAAMARRAPVCAAFSLSTADDALAAKLEPGAARPSERLRAMRALSDAGVLCGTWLNPLLPFLTDTPAQVRAAVERTHESGGQFVICHYAVTLRTGSREHFYSALDRDFPGVKERYVSAFGERYVCLSPNARALHDMLEGLCREKGMACHFDEVNARMRAPLGEQLAFF